MCTHHIKAIKKKKEMINKNFMTVVSSQEESSAFERSYLCFIMYFLILMVDKLIHGCSLLAYSYMHKYILYAYSKNFISLRFIFKTIKIHSHIHKQVKLG